MDLDRLKRRICLLLCLSLSASSTVVPAMAATEATRTQAPKTAIYSDTAPDDLRETIEQAKQMDLSQYTEESAADWNNALNHANFILNDPSATPEDIDAVIKELEKSKAGLVEKNPSEEKIEIQARFTKNVQVAVNGEEGQIANLIGMYKASFSPGETVAFTFTPVVETREFCAVTIDGERIPFDENMDTYSYTYEITVGEQDESWSFAFEIVSKEVLHQIISRAEEVKKSPEYDEAMQSVKELFDNAFASAHNVCNSHSSTQTEISAVQAELLDMINYLTFKADDKTELEYLLDIASTISNDSDLYSAASWAAFEQARKEAQAVYDDPDAWQVDIENAYGTLYIAIASLESPVNYTELETLIAEANAIDLNEYREYGKNEFLSALEEAESILSDPNSLQAEVDSAFSLLETAMSILRLLPDKSHLEELVKEAERIDFGGYTAASVAALQAAIKTSLSVLENPNATQEEVDNVFQLLEHAMTALVKVNHSKPSGGGSSGWGDDSFDLALSYAETLYSSEAYAEAVPVVQKALEISLFKAREIKEQENSGIVDIINARNNLLKACDLIVFMPGDMSFLNVLVNISKEIYLEGYATGQKELENAQQDAIKVLADQDALSADIDEATSNLVDAIINLKLPEKTATEHALLELIEQVKLLDLSHFTNTTAAYLRNALYTAQEVSNNEQATDEEITKAYERLQDTIKQLETPSGNPPTDDLFLEVGLLQESWYTPESWKPFHDAYEHAKNVYDDPASSEKEWMEAHDALFDAYDQLISVADKTSLQLILDAKDDLLIWAKADDDDGDWEHMYEKILIGVQRKFDDTNSSQVSIDYSTHILINQMRYWTLPDDPKVLNLLLSLTETFNPTDYTPASWSFFKEAQDAAKKVDTSNQLAARTALFDAYEQLTYVTDKQNLQTLYNEAKSIDITLYTEDSIRTLRNRLWDASDALEDNHYSQYDIDFYEAMLRDAVNGLQKSPARLYLKVVLDRAQEHEWGIYTAESWETFQEALQKAQYTYKGEKDRHFSDEEIQMVTDSLNEAMLQLEVSYTRSALKETIAEAEKIDLTEYAVENQQAFKDALNDAKVILADGQSSFEDMDIARIRLRNAMSALIPAPDRSELIMQIDYAKDLKEIYYTPASWTVLTQALKKAEEIRDKENSTQAKIDEASAQLAAAMRALVERVDFTRLQHAVEQADALNIDEYLPQGKDAFVQALAAARNVLKNGNATQKEIDATYNILMTAMSELRLIPDKTELRAFIDKCSLLFPDDFTPSSWEVFQNALVHAKAVYDNPNATQEDVDEAYTSLKNALEGLIRLTDKSELEALIAEAESYDAEKYTPSTWAALVTALKATKPVMDNPYATQREVNEATDSLNYALASLRERVDLTSLITLITIAGTLRETDYTPSTWAALIQALDAAKIVRDDIDATQPMADEACQALQTAIDALQKRADKTILLIWMNTAKNLDMGSYTPASASVLSKALQSADSIYKNANALQSEVNDAADALQKAIDTLQKRADTTALASAVAHAEGLDKDNYLSGWDKLIDALAQAKSVLDDANASQSLVNTALNGLQDAIRALVKKPDKSRLQRTVQQAEAEEESDYIPSTWNTFKLALEAAKAVLSNESSTQEEIDDVHEKLQLTMDNLITKPDKAFLERDIERAEALQEADYPPESWTAFKVVLDQAKAVLNDPEATRDTIDSASDALTTAREALRYDGVKKQLTQEIQLSDKLLSDKEIYTTQSWTKFVNTLTAAKKVFANQNATYEEIKNAFNRLRSDRDNLIERGDKTSLNLLLDKAKSLIQSDYYAAGWNLLHTIMAESMNVSNNIDANTLQIKDAVNALSAAITALIPLPVTEEKAKLKTLLDETSYFKESNYTSASWQPFSEALGKAKQIYSSTTVTKSQVTGVHSLLDTTKKALVNDNSGSHGGGSGGGGGSSGGGGGGSTSGDGTAAVNPSGVVPTTAPQVSGPVTSSLNGTTPLTLGTSLQFTVTSSTAPVMTQGNGKVAQLYVVKPFDGKTMTLGVYGIGHPGEATGIYANGNLLFTVSLGKAPFICDTTVDVKVAQNQAYWFTITPDQADQTPLLTVGNGSILQTASGKKTKNPNGTTTYYFAVKGIGAANSGTGVFITLAGKSYKLFNCGIK